jgi:hypothetical protein
MRRSAFVCQPDIRAEFGARHARHARHDVVIDIRPAVVTTAGQASGK